MPDKLRKPAVAAASLTTNKAKAAPILLTQDHLASGYIQAIIVNMECQCLYGPGGLKNAYRMAKGVAELRIPEDAVVVASTGVIGVQLPMEKIIRGIQEVCKDSVEGGMEAARPS